MGSHSTSWRWREGARFHNAGDDLFDLQGDFRLSGARPGNSFENAGTFRKPRGQGTAFVDAAHGFLNSGTLELQSGTLGFRGTFRETPSAAILLALTGPLPGTGYSRLTFDQAPSFAGEFRTALRDGYRPAAGTVFAVLEFPSRNGEFTALRGLDLGAGLRLAPRFTPTALELVAGRTFPPPFPLAIGRLPGSLQITWPPGIRRLAALPRHQPRGPGLDPRARDRRHDLRGVPDRGRRHLPPAPTLTRAPSRFIRRGRFDGLRHGPMARAGESPRGPALRGGVPTFSGGAGWPRLFRCSQRRSRLGHSPESGALVPEVMPSHPARLPRIHRSASPTSFQPMREHRTRRLKRTGS